mmetsp:Transcript_77259/g.213698  ORF Transcript_77259/g.213698 Transcript_77259/m.213698 type:complete len:131 (-) Transcript_77259:1311-1703(-)
MVAPCAYGGKVPAAARPSTSSETYGSCPELRRPSLLGPGPPAASPPPRSHAAVGSPTDGGATAAAVAPTTPGAEERAWPPPPRNGGEAARVGASGDEGREEPASRGEAARRPLEDRGLEVSGLGTPDCCA